MPLSQLADPRAAALPRLRVTARAAGADPLAPGSPRLRSSPRRCCSPARVPPSTSGRSRSSRSSRCCGRGTTRGRATRRCYGFVVGCAFFGVVLPWIRYFGVVAIVPFVAARWPRRSRRWPARSSAWARRGDARRRCSPRRRGSCSRRCGAAGRSAGSRGPRSASRCTTSRRRGRWRAWAACCSSRSSSSLVNGLAARPRRARCGPARTRAAVARRRRPRRGRAWSTRRGRRSPGSSRPRRAACGFALLQGNDQELAARRADRTSYLTDKHLALADQLHGHYDLIVFPESSLETDPEVDPDLRRRSPSSRAEHDAVRARQRAHRRRRRQVAQRQPPLRPRRAAAGDVREAAPRAVRRVRAVARRSSASSASCSRSRTTSSPGTAHDVPRSPAARSAP